MILSRIFEVVVKRRVVLFFIAIVLGGLTIYAISKKNNYWMAERQVGLPAIFSESRGAMTVFDIDTVLLDLRRRFPEAQFEHRGNYILEIAAMDQNKAVATERAQRLAEKMIEEANADLDKIKKNYKIIVLKDAEILRSSERGLAPVQSASADLAWSFITFLFLFIFVSGVLIFLELAKKTVQDGDGR